MLIAPSQNQPFRGHSTGIIGRSTATGFEVSEFLHSRTSNLEVGGVAAGIAAAMQNGTTDVFCGLIATNKGTAEGGGFNGDPQLRFVLRVHSVQVLLCGTRATHPVAVSQMS